MFVLSGTVVDSDRPATAAEAAVATPNIFKYDLLLILTLSSSDADPSDLRRSRAITHDFQVLVDKSGRINMSIDNDKLWPRWHHKFVPTECELNGMSASNVLFRSTERERAFQSRVNLKTHLRDHSQLHSERHRSRREPLLPLGRQRQPTPGGNDDDRSLPP